MTKPWEILQLPAVAEEDDPMGRAPGEALWPERWPIDELLARMSDVGGEDSRAWQALYMQRPLPPSGAMFRVRDFRYWERAPGYDPRARVLIDARRYDTEQWPVGMTCDTALKEKEENDWTVIMIFIVAPSGEMLFLDVIRERLQVPDQWPLIRTLWRRWRPGFFGVEDRASGTGIIQHAEREGIPCVPLMPSTDKVTRAEPISNWVRANRVYFELDAPWVGELEKELRSFPFGMHDDQVDAFAYARHLAFDMTFGGSALPVKEKGEKLPDSVRAESLGLPADFFTRAGGRRGARETVRSKYYEF